MAKPATVQINGRFNTPEEAQIFFKKLLINYKSAIGMGWTIDENKQVVLMVYRNSIEIPNIHQLIKDCGGYLIIL